MSDSITTITTAAAIAAIAIVDVDVDVRVEVAAIGQSCLSSPGLRDGGYLYPGSSRSIPGLCGIVIVTVVVVAFHSELAVGLQSQIEGPRICM
jgi:hypothetical protein